MVCPIGPVAGPVYRFIQRICDDGRGCAYRQRPEDHPGERSFYSRPLPAIICNSGEQTIQPR